MTQSFFKCSYQDSWREKIHENSQLSLGLPVTRYYFSLHLLCSQSAEFPVSRIKIRNQRNKNINLTIFLVINCHQQFFRFQFHNKVQILLQFISLFSLLYIFEFSIEFTKRTSNDFPPSPFLFFLSFSLSPSLL